MLQAARNALETAERIMRARYEQMEEIKRNQAGDTKEIVNTTSRHTLHCLFLSVNLNYGADGTISPFHKHQGLEKGCQTHNFLMRFPNEV